MRTIFAALISVVALASVATTVVQAEPTGTREHWIERNTNQN
jgi:hypothetical protein